MPITRMSNAMASHASRPPICRSRRSAASCRRARLSLREVAPTVPRHCLVVAHLGKPASARQHRNLSWSLR
jgi:hypothetical protein